MAKVTYGRPQPETPGPIIPEGWVERATLWAAFTNDEQATLSSSTSKNAKALINTLSFQPILNKGRIFGILTALEATGVLGSGRAQEIVDALP